MSTIPSTASASQIQMDYMKLLVTQLQNQNPLEPMDNNDMASQLAQFSQLQQLEEANGNLTNMNSSLNSNFADVLDAANKTYANSMIGKDISFLITNDAGGYEELVGTVKEVFNDPEKGSLLLVETENGSEYTLNLEGVISVKN